MRVVQVSLLLFFSSDIFVWSKSKLMLEIPVFYIFTFQLFSNIRFPSICDIKLLHNPIHPPRPPLPPPPKKKKFCKWKEYEAKLLSRYMKLLGTLISKKIVDF